jgi:hypothetical protein
VEALRNGSRNFEIKVRFAAPPQLQNASEEMGRIGKSP